MCEGLSKLKYERGGKPVTDETKRYIGMNRYETKSRLRFLNLTDLKKIGDKSMKAVCYNLFPNIADLSIWGCYGVTSDGFLEICVAHRNEVFKRINYCGCYKIKEDSRMWISSTFNRIIIYSQIDEFGKYIDYSSWD